MTRGLTDSTRIALLVLTAVVILVVTTPWKDHPAATGKSDTNSVAQEEAKSIALSLRSRSEIIVKAPPTRAKETFEDFQRKKFCATHSEAQAQLADEISALQNGLASAGTNIAPAMEREISAKRQELVELSGCEKLEGAKPVENARDMLARLAKAGDREAQLEYATNPMIDPFHSISNLPELRAWRADALNYINTLVAANDPKATVILAEASDPLICQASSDTSCGGLLSKVVQKDPKDAYRLYYLQSLQGDAPQWTLTELGALERFLTSEQISELRSAAQTQFDKTN